MKRVDLDRDEIVRALAAEPSISDAARTLGVARRTLQDRMRALGMAPGKSGRPTRKIKYSRGRGASGAGLGLAAAALVGGVFIGRRFLKGGGA